MFKMLPSKIIFSHLKNIINNNFAIFHDVLRIVFMKIVFQQGIHLKNKLIYPLSLTDKDVEERAQKF